MFQASRQKISLLSQHCGKLFQKHPLLASSIVAILLATPSWLILWIHQSFDWLFLLVSVPCLIISVGFGMVALEQHAVNTRQNRLK